MLARSRVECGWAGMSGPAATSVPPREPDSPSALAAKPRRSRQKWCESATTTEDERLQPARATRGGSSKPGSFPEALEVVQATVVRNRWVRNL